MRGLESHQFEKSHKEATIKSEKPQRTPNGFNGFIGGSPELWDYNCCHTHKWHLCLDGYVVWMDRSRKGKDQTTNMVAISVRERESQKDWGEAEPSFKGWDTQALF